MKVIFGTVLFAASVLGLNLEALSLQEDTNGKFVYDIHEGAAMNYALLGDSPVNYDYNGTTGAITHPYTTSLPYIEMQVAGSSDPITFMPPGETGELSDFSFDSENTLLLNGQSDVFYACLNIQDPYDYTTSIYAVVYAEGTPTVGTCHPITLRAINNSCA